MSLLNYLCKLYSFDTLDTRFSISATTPPRGSATELQGDPARPSPADGSRALKRDGSPTVQPSRWKTPEFYFYYLIFFLAVPSMFGVAFQVSRPSHPNYSRYESLLSKGWIPGRKVDNSDQQYASFRDNIPYMLMLLVLHPLLRRAYDSFWRSATYTNIRANGNGLSQGLTTEAAADARLEQRVSFDLGFAIIFLAALNGVSALKVLFILYINFKIAIGAPKPYVPGLTWLFNVGILFANEMNQGYSFAKMSGAVPGVPMLHRLGAAADSFGGINPRWEVLFNITVLRLISFNMDYYWGLSSRGSSLVERQLDPSNLSERDRVSIPAAPHHFSLRNYLAYALYPPLYLAGPILTFNDYISQQRYRPASLSHERTILYAVRFIIVLLAMELVLHFIYAVAISKAQPNWAVYTPFQLSMLGYFNLHIIWLKLLIPWRFFRLWALLDGIDPPENMVRCMSDNYSALAFWRGWHRSFNRWIVRYIYVPLGGNGKSQVRCIVNFLAVFTFVALWHDINLRLLMWGWLITLFVLPEILATLLFPAKKWRNRPTEYRVLCGVGAVGNILMMMAANLVGFAVGMDGLKGLVQGIVGSLAGVAFLACACGALFVGAQVMFEVREQERRDGIRMKC